MISRSTYAQEENKQTAIFRKKNDKEEMMLPIENSDFPNSIKKWLF